MVNIKYSVPVGECAKAEIFNAAGMKVMEIKLAGVKGEKDLNIRSWAAGVYLFHFNCNGKIHTQKLVISR